MDKKIWFTSDQHFGHKNIIDGCNRPFSSTEEMDSVIIQNWNSVVGKNDIVYTLGDFSFHKNEVTTRYLNILNGEIHLIKGNHDARMKKHIRDKFSSVSDYKELRPTKQSLIVMSHFPFLSWNKSHYGSIHLHGHCHGTINNEGVKRYDVGVDSNSFTPVSLDFIIEKFSE